MSQPLPPPVLQKYYAAEGQLSDAESAFKQAWANRKSLGDHLIDAGDGHSYEKTEWIRNNVGLVIGEALNRLNSVLASYPALSANTDLTNAIHTMNGESSGFCNDYYTSLGFGMGYYNNVNYADQTPDDSSTVESELESARTSLAAQVTF